MGDFNAKHTDFNCSKRDKQGIALKKALYDADILIVENSIPTHQDTWTNTSDIIDYVISSRAVYNNTQNLSLNNDRSSDHLAILFNFSTKINRSIFLPNEVNLYHKVHWDPVNSSVSNQLATIWKVMWFLIENYV